MVTENASQRAVAKLIDLETSGTLRQSRQINCPYWIAPEVIQGESATTCSDVFSLAVVVWEVLTGHQPYDEADTPDRHALAKLIVAGLRPSVPRDFPLQISVEVTRAWIHDPHERPSASQLLDAIKAVFSLGAHSQSDA